MLSKLRYHCNLNILRITYYSIFGSYLLYGCQLWGQANTGHPNTINTIKTMLCKTNQRCNPTNQLYKELKIQKFSDLVHLHNYLFVIQLQQNKNLAKSFVSLNYCGDKQDIINNTPTKQEQ